MSILIPLSSCDCPRNKNKNAPSNLNVVKCVLYFSARTLVNFVFILLFSINEEFIRSNTHTQTLKIRGIAAKGTALQQNLKGGSFENKSSGVWFGKET